MLYENPCLPLFLLTVLHRWLYNTLDTRAICGEIMKLCMEIRLSFMANLGSEHKTRFSKKLETEKTGLVVIFY